MAGARPSPLSGWPLVLEVLEVLELSLKRKIVLEMSLKSLNYRENKNRPWKNNFRCLNVLEVLELSKFDWKCPWSPWISSICLRLSPAAAFSKGKFLPVAAFSNEKFSPAAAFYNQKFSYLLVKTLPMAAFITLVQYHRLTINIKWYSGLFFKQLKSVFSFFYCYDLTFFSK